MLYAILAYHAEGVVELWTLARPHGSARRSAP